MKWFVAIESGEIAAEVKGEIEMQKELIKRKEH